LKSFNKQLADNKQKEPKDLAKGFNIGLNNQNNGN
jgi:hypothetical protein